MNDKGLLSDTVREILLLDDSDGDDVSCDWGSEHDSDIGSDIGEQFDNEIVNELINNTSEMHNNEDVVVEAEVEQEETNNDEVVNDSAGWKEWKEGDKDFNKWKWSQVAWGTSQNTIRILSTFFYRFTIDGNR